MMNRGRANGLLKAMAAAALLWGCSVPVAGSLDERDANLVADALNRAGIEATKEVDPASEGRYQVLVPRGETAPAIAALREHDLPPRHAPGVIDAVGKGALVPSPLAEHAQYVAGLAGDLERSFASIDGVLGARVHLSVPADDPLSGQPARKPSASVLLRYSGATPPIGDDQVRHLVAGAVAGLAVEDVTVVTMSRPVSTSVPARAMAQIGPISVTRASANLLRGMLGGAVLLLLALGSTILVLWLRIRRATAQASVGERA
jgi:type III secretion protein J